MADKSITVRVAKAGGELQVPWHKLPENAQLYIIVYGLTQALNDAHSDITKGGAKPFEGTDGEFKKAVLAASRAKLNDLMNGVVRRGGGGARLSPIEREVRAIVESLLVSKHGMTVGEARKHTLSTYIEAFLPDHADEVTAKIEAMAKKRVAVAAKDLDDFDVGGAE